MTEVICKYCGDEFMPQPKHPGYINVCLDETCREERQTNRESDEALIEMVLAEGRKLASNAS